MQLFESIPRRESLQNQYVRRLHDAFAEVFVLPCHEFLGQIVGAFVHILVCAGEVMIDAELR